MKRSRIGPKTYEAALASRIAQDARRREKASQKPRKSRISSHKPLERKHGLLQRRSKPLKRKKISKEEMEWREGVLDRAGNRCQWVDRETELRCEIRGKESLDAHHICKRSQRPDLKLSPENGAALCRLHHDYTDTVEGRAEAIAQNLLSTETYEAAMKAKQ